MAEQDWDVEDLVRQMEERDTTVAALRQHTQPIKVGDIVRVVMKMNIGSDDIMAKGTIAIVLHKEEASTSVFGSHTDRYTIRSPDGRQWVTSRVHIEKDMAVRRS